MDTWGADVPVSMPEPLPAGVEPLVDMDGFTMTRDGLRHNLPQAVWERLSRPTYAPYDPGLPEEPQDFTVDDAGREWL